MISLAEGSLDDFWKRVPVWIRARRQVLEKKRKINTGGVLFATLENGRGLLMNTGSGANHRSTDWKAVTILSCSTTERYKRYR